MALFKHEALHIVVGTKAASRSITCAEILGTEHFERIK